MKRYLIIGSMILCFVFHLHAQNNTSPYSIIGIGDIEHSNFDRTTGMGYAGLALSSNRFFYQSNPASYARLDEHFFYLEMSSRFRSVGYSGKPVTDPINNRSSDVQFKKLTLAIKPGSRWAVGVGLIPYSTSNYSFSSKKVLQGSNLDIDTYYEGSGSTNQFYITNSFIVAKDLFVGLQASYLFGQMQETETLSQDISDSALSTNRNIVIGNPNLKLGVQYSFRLGKEMQLLLGATLSHKTKLKANYALQVKDGNTIILDDQYYKSGYFTLPLTYAAGVAATYKNAYTLAFDYTYQGWSNLHYQGINYSLVNSQRFSAGAEYTKKLKYLNQSFEQYFFQAGFFYSNSYLRLAGQQLNNYGATFGAGMQLASSGLGLQGAMEIGKRGTSDAGLIKEKYTQFTMTISYRDFWPSRKMKRYD